MCAGCGKMSWMLGVLFGRVRLSVVLSAAAKLLQGQPFGGFMCVWCGTLHTIHRLFVMPVSTKRIDGEEASDCYCCAGLWPDERDRE
jgi:hypothetical protein